MGRVNAGSKKYPLSLSRSCDNSSFQTLQQFYTHVILSSVAFPTMIKYLQVVALYLILPEHSINGKH